MDQQLTKKYIDSLNIARSITSLMPPLPDGLTPRQIRVMDCIRTGGKGSGITISDTAALMHSTLPSITKLIGELSSKGYVVKKKSPRDGRFFTVELTDKGAEIHRKYVIEYHSKLASLLSGITDSDMETAISVIMRTYDLMKNNRIDLEEDAE